MNSTHQTVLEINLDHLTHNYTYLKSKLATGVKFLGVVKASGYGSDAVTIATHLEKIGVDYLAVAYASEGIALREAKIKTPILVLHPQPANFDKLIEYKLEPSLYSFNVLKGFIEAAAKKNKIDYPVHIKFNTGLNRIGFAKDDVNKICELITASKHIHTTSLFSHLAASDDLQEKEFTKGQIQDFKQIISSMNTLLGHTTITHQSNTSAILNYPEAHFDMVRSGIGLYGYGNNNAFDKELKPVVALKSVISQLLTLAPNESLGYNRAFVAKKETKTATLPIGHADGISRQYGNEKSFVMIQGQKANIIGNVCMDMLMVDVTAIDCKEGDEVIIFDETINAAMQAKNIGTISYELLTAIAPRVKRIVIENNKMR